MSDPYYDGDFDAAAQDGAIIPAIDPDSRGRIWTVPMIQRATLWEPLALDTPGPTIDEVEQDGILTEETTPSAAGGPLVKWERIYRQVPATYFEPLPFVYIYPKIVDGAIVEGSVSTTIMMERAFFNTSEPNADIEVLRKSVFADETALTTFLGTIFDEDLIIIAEDSKIDRPWKGNLWRRSTPYVPKLTLMAALGL